MPNTAIASNYLEDALFDHVLRNSALASPVTVYVALFNVDPGDDGLSGTEVAVGAYARQAVTFSAPTNGVGSNTGTVTYPTATADWGSVGGWGIFDAVGGGNLLFHGALEQTKYITNGHVVTFEIGDLEITFT